MKCPHCGLIVTDAVPKCVGCDFTIAELDAVLTAPPSRQGFVTDMARLLDPAQHRELDIFLQQFADDNRGEIVVVTVPATHPVKPSEYVFWLFNHWEIGGSGHTGAIILLSIAERRVESEIGYGWETYITDHDSGEMLDREVMPLLEKQDVAGALRTAATALMDIISRHRPAGQSPDVFPKA